MDTRLCDLTYPISSLSGLKSFFTTGAYTPVGTYNENIGIDGKIFAVPTANVETYGASREVF